MKKTFFVIYVVSYSRHNHDNDYAFSYYCNDEKRYELRKRYSYEAGMKLLRRLEKKTGKLAEMDCNMFNPMICTKKFYIM